MILFNAFLMDSHSVNSDGTYKTNYLDFPVFMTGTTDRSKAYQPYGLQLTLTETYEDYAFVYEVLKTSAAKLGLKEYKVTIIFF